MIDVLHVRLAKIAQAEFDDGDVPWDDLSDEDRNRWERAALKVYQIGVADALKDPGSA
jgi:hypothetical protein